MLSEVRKFFPMILKLGMDIEGCRPHEATGNKSYPKPEILGLGDGSEFLFRRLGFLNGQGRAP